MRNVTRVKNLIVDTPWTEAYDRPEVTYAPDCSDYYEYVCGDGINGNYYCGNPSITDFETPLDTITQSISVGLLKNNFVLSTESIALQDSCNYVGFKNVAAKKIWHGKLPFTSKTYGAPDTID